MKMLMVLLVVIASVACNKETLSTRSEEPVIEASVEPKINSVEFYRVAAGSNVSVGFTVTLQADSATVGKVVLMRVGSTQIRWEVKKPTTGRYVMYDHLGDYPTYSQNALYYFSFIRKDGSHIETTPFQVY